jgi:precorrin-6A/cobalt-precorrin-6A reductase
VRVLVLGGSGEGRALAERLARTPGLHVISSLAGRVAEPRLPPGVVRIGGFDGIDGLAAYLTIERIAAVVDATHPFAARITAAAATACGRLGVPLLVLRRPGWRAGDGDDWRCVPDLDTAAGAVAASPPGVVLLTVGRRGLTPFAADAVHEYLIRSVDPADGDPLPPRHTAILARGPFTVDGERDLLRAHDVTLLVTKDSGGEATAAKLVAARELGLPVVMIDRPPLPAGLPSVSSIDAAEAWAMMGSPASQSDQGFSRHI